MADQLKGLTTNDLQHCIEQWKTCMQQCVDIGGEYIEGIIVKLLIFLDKLYFYHKSRLKIVTSRISFI